MSNCTFNYWCQDCTCGAKGAQRDFEIDKPESKAKRKEICPNNGSPMKLMGQKVTILKSMDKDTRIKSLKKRSKDHFKREIAEKRVEIVKKSHTKGGGITG